MANTWEWLRPWRERETPFDAEGVCHERLVLQLGLSQLKLFPVLVEIPK